MMISEPILLLNEAICKNNIRRMAEKANQFDLTFRPHMKTHQSAHIGRWFREVGVQAITVSSLKMARYFANHGWKDITIAIPCNVLQLAELDALAQKVNLSILINHKDTFSAVRQKLSNRVNAYIEIDTGGNRTGRTPEEIEDIRALIHEMCSYANITWKGFYTHAGHSYRARSREAIEQIHASVLHQLQELRNTLEPEISGFKICSGDTPCCSAGTDFEGVDAISPGNFVFYDLMQHQIGSCELSDIAVAVSCPVIDRYPKRNEIAIHGGAIHFSKEFLSSNGMTHYGRPAERLDNADGWSLIDNSSHLKKISQEHGILHCSEEQIQKYQIGDTITIMPIHSCLTANLLKRYLTEDGTVIEQMQMQMQMQ